MKKKKTVPWWGLMTGRQVLVGLLILLAALSVLTVVAARKMSRNEAVIKACDKVCEVSKKFDKVYSENIDLRNQVHLLEVKLKKKNPHGSRHFYNCIDARKGSRDWNLALYSATTNKLHTWSCDSWHGHTSQKLPPAEQLQLVCTDEKGTRYPYE
jgi:hypothetical protein